MIQDVNKKRHKLLELLAKKKSGALYTEDNFSSRKGVIGVEIDVITKNIGVTRNQLIVFTEAMVSDGEIQFYGIDIDGYSITRKGMSSYLSRKYLDLDTNKRREKSSFYIRNTVSLVSIIIAAISISLNMYQWQSKEEQHQDQELLKDKLEDIHRRINSIEESSKKKDSLLQRTF